MIVTIGVFHDLSPSHSFEIGSYFGEKASGTSAVTAVN